MMPKRLLIFALAFGVFFVGPALLGFPFPPYPLMKIGDVFDLLTPLVLMPLYFSVFRSASDRPLTVPMTVAWIVVGSLWVLGHGVHLAANSIGHQLVNARGTAPYNLTLFYDETLSHYLWHLGVMGLAGLILIRAWDAGPAPVASRWTLGAAAVVYGLMFFIIVVEGQTCPVGLPFAVIIAAAVFWRERGFPRGQGVVSWLGWSHLLAVVLLIGWRLYWGECIEFSRLGWI